MDITGGGEENATKIRSLLRDQNRIGNENDETRSDGDEEFTGWERHRGRFTREGVFETKRGKEHPFIAMQLGW